MTSLRKAILLALGCLVLVIGVSIGVSWYRFGYLDWVVIGRMGMIFLLVPFTLVIGILIGIGIMVRKINREWQIRKGPPKP